MNRFKTTYIDRKQQRHRQKTTTTQADRKQNHTEKKPQNGRKNSLTKIQFN